MRFATGNAGIIVPGVGEDVGPETPDTGLGLREWVLAGGIETAPRR